MWWPERKEFSRESMSMLMLTPCPRPAARPSGNCGRSCSTPDRDRTCGSGSGARSSAAAGRPARWPAQSPGARGCSHPLRRSCGHGAGAAPVPVWPGPERYGSPRRRSRGGRRGEASSAQGGVAVLWGAGPCARRLMSHTVGVNRFVTISPGTQRSPSSSSQERGAWGSPLGRVQNSHSTGRSGAATAGDSRLRAPGMGEGWAKGWEGLLRASIGR